MPSYACLFMVPGGYEFRYLPAKTLKDAYVDASKIIYRAGKVQGTEEYVIQEMNVFEINKEYQINIDDLKRLEGSRLNPKVDEDLNRLNFLMNQSNLSSNEVQELLSLRDVYPDEYYMFKDQLNKVDRVEVKSNEENKE